MQFAYIQYLLMGNVIATLPPETPSPSLLSDKRWAYTSRTWVYTVHTGRVLFLVPPISGNRKLGIERYSLLFRDGHLLEMPLVAHRSNKTELTCLVPPKLLPS